MCPFSGQAAVCGRHPSRQDPEGVSPLGGVPSFIQLDPLTCEGSLLMLLASPFL